MKLFGIMLLFAGLAFGVEPPGITIAGGETLVGSSGIMVEIEPEVCESRLYRWDGENLRCATVDRVGHVKVQRNHNMRALKVCRAEVNYLRGAALLAAMNNEQRAACREMGKVFDEIEVICTGSLTPGEEK